MTAIITVNLETGEARTVGSMGTMARLAAIRMLAERKQDARLAAMAQAAMDQMSKEADGR